MCGKKKILFVCYGMGIGGIEKCMVNLINVMPEEKYDAAVLAVAHGEFLNMDLKNCLKDGAVVFDIKGVLPVEITDERL